MDAGAVQRLTDIDIAEARDDALVEQQQLDRGGAPGQSALQLSRVEVERLRPERPERRPILKAARTHQVQRTEPPGVVQRDAAVVVGLDDEVVVLLAAVGSTRHRPDMPRWKTSVSPRSVSIRPYFARRPRLVTRAPSVVVQGSEAPGAGRAAVPRRAMRLPFRTRSSPRTVVSTSGSSGMRPIWRRRHKPARGAAL